MITGLLAGMLAWPAALLPFFSIVTAIVFGIGTGFGTASGARAIRRCRREPGGNCTPDQSTRFQGISQ